MTNPAECPSDVVVAQWRAEYQQAGNVWERDYSRTDPMPLGTVCQFIARKAADWARAQGSDESPTLRTELDGLAMCMWRDFYREDAPNFELLDTALGVATQIDNMYAGLREKLTAANARIAELEAMVPRWIDRAEYILLGSLCMKLCDPITNKDGRQWFCVIDRLTMPSPPAPPSDKAEPQQPDIDYTDYKSLWLELVMQVGNKYENETRHQTALRYIRRAEEPKATDNIAKQEKP